MEPHGQSPWHLTNARAGRHPRLKSGQTRQKLAHSLPPFKTRGVLSAAGVNCLPHRELTRFPILDYQQTPGLFSLAAFFSESSQRQLATFILSRT
jgi:hypothetical protein